MMTEYDVTKVLKVMSLVELCAAYINIYYNNSGGSIEIYQKASDYLHSASSTFISDYERRQIMDYVAWYICSYRTCYSFDEVVKTVLDIAGSLI